jgi:methyl coenzyme M reductase subunit C-like uncharacterized protein (methanogenesis marker protein 7)
METLERKKYRVISAIVGDTDRKRVSEIERLYSPEPCVYSDDELRASVFKRVAEFEAGNVVPIPHEQIKRKTV